MEETAKSEIAYFKRNFTEDLRRFFRIFFEFRIIFGLMMTISFYSGNAYGQENEHIRFGERDRCPVCAMSVAKYPDFACAMKLTNDKTFYFCGSGCLIRTWLHPEDFLGIEKNQIRSVWVRDYFTGEEIDGTEAHWVAGSDVIGPMGPAIVPLKTQKSAGIFRKRHGGKFIFMLPEMTDAKWKEITGKNAGK